MRLALGTFAPKERRHFTRIARNTFRGDRLLKIDLLWRDRRLDRRGDRRRRGLRLGALGGLAQLGKPREAGGVSAALCAP
jgi:hypothetical protein